jgi:hypothetical protein
MRLGEIITVKSKKGMAPCTLAKYGCPYKNQMIDNGSSYIMLRRVYANKKVYYNRFHIECLFDWVKYRIEESIKKELSVEDKRRRRYLTQIRSRLNVAGKKSYSKKGWEIRRVNKLLEVERELEEMESRKSVREMFLGDKGEVELGERVEYAKEVMERVKREQLGEKVI